MVGTIIIWGRVAPGVTAGLSSSMAPTAMRPVLLPNDPARDDSLLAACAAPPPGGTAGFVQQCGCHGVEAGPAEQSRL